ncbi:hypothetical protein LX97_00493 [Nonlabens dokdonensis]|jgi:hypothetical protein|uniref:Uncharacterized protein n=2 Tax=Nonlabens dokdonensis TaxID=328515 RepID=L7WAC5_NONDD|nr:hypothetical protein [Nonlabens dokdonensis]AGC75808.1 hypothetical protein DDD_0681 [Nonlabens dokdonensis DSW-6]PZX43492.1 hypothetical protein LX97_00493 [Nonlabens dokdonensis]
MKKKLKQSVIDAIMDRAIEINKGCKEQCRDFEIMLSRKRENSLILRWTSIDISNEDNPVQQYRYECFQTDGTSQMCSVHYADQDEANEFIWSLEPLYHQQFAIDHKL